MSAWVVTYDEPVGEGDTPTATLVINWTAELRRSYGHRGQGQAERIAEEKKLKRYLCVCLEPRPRTTEGVVVLPFHEFLQALWSGEYR